MCIRDSPGQAKIGNIHPGQSQKFRKKYTVSHMNCVFQALQYKVDVFPPQRPYLEIDLKILNNFLKINFLIVNKINDF